MGVPMPASSTLPHTPPTQAFHHNHLQSLCSFLGATHQPQDLFHPILGKSETGCKAGYYYLVSLTLSSELTTNETDKGFLNGGVEKRGWELSY